MPRDLPADDRGILEQRPNIAFVEPRVLPVPPRPIPAELPPVEAVKNELAQTKALANAVDVLAGLIQARVNLKAKDMEIDLDPKIDAPVIGAMARAYPDADSTVITYEQYIACKNKLLERGVQVADQALVNSNPDVIAEARKAPVTDDYEAAKKTALYGSKKAKRGGLRPELDENNMIIEPIDMDEFQKCMIKILTNYIWKKFIRPILFIVLNAMIPFSGFALPKKLTKCPKGFKVKELLEAGAPILGEKKPKKQKPPEVDASAIIEK